MISIAILATVFMAEPFPEELTTFDAGVVVELSGASRSWDVAMRERGAVVRRPDGALYLYYTGYDGTREGIKKIGLATSTDDGHTWRVVQDTPVTPDGLWTEDPCVLIHDGQWHMFAEGRGDQAHHLTSADGVTWTADGSLDVRLASGEPIPPGPYGTPTVFVENDVWHLFYERRDAGVWLATSSDLRTWTNVSDEPVLVPGPGGFDAAMIALNQIVTHDGRYYAYYHGADRLQKPRQWAVGVAVSDDLRTWTKFSGNPLTEPADNVSSGQVIFTHSPEKTPVLFTTHAAVRRHP